MMRLSTMAMVAVLGLGGLLGASGCTTEVKANTVLGEQKVPEGYTPTTVEKLVNEDRWKGQKVFFEGSISKIGCAGCGGVIIADKTWRISTEPANPSKFTIPVKTGAPLRVWGVLSVTGDGFREVKAHRVEFVEPSGGKKS